MEKIVDEFINSRPQRLCHMCGKCCRLAVTVKTHDELISLAQSGDEGSQDFLKLFEPYLSTNEARTASKDTVDNIIRHMTEDNIFDETKITFYKCRYIQDDNLCSIYQDRLELCDRFPSSPWAVVPPGCGFEGWLFQQREGIKQQVRKQKENLLSLEDMLKVTANEELKVKIRETIEKTKGIIELYAKYGSKDW